MKKTIIISIVLSVIFSLLLYLNHKNNTSNNQTISSEVYFLQVGAYKKYENVSNITKLLPFYVVVKENDLFHIYVGITKKEENINKIKVFYNLNGNNIYIKPINISNKEFLSKLETYDYLLSEADNKEVIFTLSKEMLKTYEEYKNEN